LSISLFEIMPTFVIRRPCLGNPCEYSFALELKQGYVSHVFTVERWVKLTYISRPSKISWFPSCF